LNCFDACRLARAVCSLTADPEPTESAPYFALTWNFATKTSGVTPPTYGGRKGPVPVTLHFRRNGASLRNLGDCRTQIRK
jgi:hypothetical protein